MREPLFEPFLFIFNHGELILHANVRREYSLFMPCVLSPVFEPHFIDTNKLIF